MMSSIDKLEELKNYYENIIAKLPGHVFWKNRDTILQGCNDLQAKNLGFKSREEIVGKTNYDMIVNYSSEEDRKKQADDISQVDIQVMETNTTLVVEEPLQLPGGERRIYLSNKSPLHDKEGKVIGLLGIAFDITAEKEAERLNQEKIEAEKQSQYLRAAAGSIAHELRTPLMIIGMSSRFMKTYWHILIETYLKAKDAGISIEDIDKKSLHHIENRIDGILKQIHYSNAFIDLVLGNLKEGDFDASGHRTSDMKMIVDSCIKQYPFEDKSNEHLLVHWEDTHTFKFKGDEFLMTNVLNNLIKNSLYFIKAAGKGEIYIWIESHDDQNVLCFKDTAQGASQEVISNLFRSFYSKRQGGTGLGLAFCKKIINSFGGTIEASSIESEYMQFALSFPIISESNDSADTI